MDCDDPTAPKKLRYLEDLVVGERRRSTARLVTGAEIITFAQQFDPQSFHTDPQQAATCSFGGLVASGLHTAALWRRMDHEINGDIAFICGLGWDETRWTHPLRPGDLIHAESELLSKRPSGSQMDRGVCRFASSVRLMDGTVLLSFVGINLVYTSAFACSRAAKPLLSVDQPFSGSR